MSSTVTFEDLAQMEKRILGRTAPASIVPDVDRATKFRRLLQSDLAIGRLLTGPQMIDTVAIDNGAITAEKLTASLVISTEIIAGAVSPADRLTLDATGIKAYGTVTGTPNTNTLTIGVNGDFTFGTGATAITFVASTGVLTVPAAAIGSLTIANVGSGNIGGTYATNSGNPKVELSPTQFRMTNGSGVNVFSLNATTGVFTMSDSPAGANRLDITSGSISLYKASTREFYLAASGASNPVEMLLTGGGAGQYVGMNAVDGIWTGASTFSGAATKFRVSPAGVLDATAANISGAITATSGSLSSLSIAGTLTMGASGLIRTSATTTRVEMDNTGLYGYNSGTLRFQVLNNGSGFLGASTTLSWTSAGALTLAGFSASSTTLSSGSGGSFVTMSSGSTAFSAGNATPGSAPFRVTSAGALTATNADITGEINAVTGFLQDLTIAGTLTLGSGGEIVDADGSYWDQTGIVLKSAGTYGDTIKWQQSGSDTGSVYATTSAMVIRGDPSTGGALELYPSEVILRYNGTNESLQLQSTNRRALFAGYIYPGTGSAAQTSRYWSDNGAGINYGGASVGGSVANWSSGWAAGAYFLMSVNGTTRRVPFFGDA